MKLSKIFSDVSKDWHLISITRKNTFSTQLEEQLELLGWRREKKPRYIVDSSENGRVLFFYEDNVYVCNEALQGNKKWYKDLANLTFPSHSPGLLTKILG